MKDGGKATCHPNSEARRNGSADPRCDPLLLYGPRPEGESSLRFQIVAATLIIAALVLVVYLLSG